MATQTTTQKTTWAPPTVYALPVTGISSPTLTVRDARELLKLTRLILSNVLNAPVGYPAILRQALLNVRFHVVSGLSFIDSYLGAGYYQDDNVSDVEGLSEAIYNHLTAIQQAKPVWDSWAREVKTVHKQPDAPQFTAPASPPSQSALAGDTTGATAPVVAPPSAFDEVSKPTPMKTYVGMAIVGGVGLLLWRLFR